MNNQNSPPILALKEKYQTGQLCDKNDCFQGQRENEVVECILMRHWIVLFPIFSITIAAVFALFGFNAIIAYFIPRNNLLFNQVSTIFDFFYIALILHFFFINVLNYYLKFVIITNLRIIDIQFSTIFKRNMDALDLHNIQDINMTQQGFWRWIFNFGKIIMHNAAGTELFDFSLLKNPLKNYNIINHVHFKAMHNQNILNSENKKKEEDNHPPLNT